MAAACKGRVAPRGSTCVHIARGALVKLLITHRSICAGDWGYAIPSRAPGNDAGHLLHTLNHALSLARRAVPPQTQKHDGAAPVLQRRRAAA